MKSKPVIAIIGGGFCGAAVLINLIRNATEPLKIVLINKDKVLAKGVAFNSSNHNHLLNVRVSNMSPFVNEPLHFAEWISRQSELKAFMSTDFIDKFITRNVYGKYIASLLEKTIAEAPKFLDIEIIIDEVTSINKLKNKQELVLGSKETFIAEKVVLALGVFPPGNITIPNMAFYDSKKYFANPWNRNALKNIYLEESIFLIGTGLTSIDLIISLIQKGYHGKVYSFSKNGRLPLIHTDRKAYTAIQAELKVGLSLITYFKIFKKHLKLAWQSGYHTADVIDALRPITQQLWMGLNVDDKKQFIRHLSSLWNIARHRVPPQAYNKMQELIKSGKLELLSGNLNSIEEQNGKAVVTLKNRKSGCLKTIVADRIINCTGPQSDILKIDQPLIKNLLSNGTITPNELKIGIHTDTSCKVIDSNNKVSEQLYAIGAILRGLFWESSAVPELRKQAEFVAKNIIKELQEDICNPKASFIEA